MHLSYCVGYFLEYYILRQLVSMSKKVAVVTGSNKGIGFAIVRGLCKQFDGDVYLTSREEGRGHDAIKILNDEGLDPKFHQLDVLNSNSINALKDFLQSKYGGVDILVNNAGIAYKSADTTPFAEQAEVTMKTNYTALLNVCDIMFPILKPGARVVQISSSVTMMFLKRSSDEKVKQIVATESIDQVTALMDEFVSDAKEGQHKERGWADWAYAATKVGVSAITPVQQAVMDKDRPDQDIVINCVCPGMVATDMAAHKGGLTPDQGAETPIYAALLPEKESAIRGCFLYQKTVYNWKAGECPSFKKP